MDGDGSAVPGIDQVGDPNPAMFETFTLAVRELLDMLDEEQLKRIAIRRLEGYTNREIAADLDIAMHAVERKLQLIRQKWNS